MTKPIKVLSDQIEPGSFVRPPNHKEELIMHIGKLLAEANLAFSELETLLTNEEE